MDSLRRTLDIIILISPEHSIEDKEIALQIYLLKAT